MSRGIQRESIYTLKLLRRGIDIEAGKDVNLLKSMLVTDFMTRHPETVLESTPLRGLIAILQYSQHTSFPVVDSRGKLVGMLSLRDFRDAIFEDSLMDVIIARDIATIPEISVTTEDNLAQALMLIDENGIERLPVMRDGDHPNEVAGILSQRDIMSAYRRALEASGLQERSARPKNYL